MLTLEALAKHALKPAQCLKLETEARTGEFKIEEAKKESERELQRLLGKPSTQFRSSPQHPMGSNGSTTLPAPSKPGSSSRIERAAHRDPVGEQVFTGTSTKCSYLGIIEVTRRQFQETGTTCVECRPAMHAVRSKLPKISLIFHRILCAKAHRQKENGAGYCRNRSGNWSKTEYQFVFASL